MPSLFAAGQGARLQPSPSTSKVLTQLRMCETAAWAAEEENPTTDVVWGLDAALEETFCYPFICWVLAFWL